MSLSRLVALGLLSEHGPMHGHELRRRAEERHVESWGGVRAGALYRELHSLAAEGLIELVRNEQVGKRPARSVYQVTAAGCEALRALRAETLGAFARPPDTVGVGLLLGGFDDPEGLLETLGRRRRAAAATFDVLMEKRAELEARSVLGAPGRAVFRRAELCLRAELAWHEDCASELVGAPELSPGPPVSRDAARAAGTGQAGPARPSRGGTAMSTR